MFDLSPVWKWLRGSGKRRATVRKPPRARLALEALDERILLSVTELPIPIIDTLSSRPEGITRGPDGNLWFTENSAGRIGRITPAGVVTQFSAGLTPGSQPAEITAGPDGNLWFTETGSSRIGRITTAGVITEFSAGITPNSGPTGITRGPDGNLWFTEHLAGRIGRITPAGVVTEFSAGLTPGGQPNLITAGPDGNLWFGENAGKIGRITPAGVITEFSAGLAQGSQILGITAGPDGNLWFTEANFNRIGRITPAGVITEVADVGTTPLEITTGPDGNLWFTEFGSSGRIGRLTTAGAFTEFAAGITTGASPFGIAVGPDGNIWFAEASVTGQFNTIGRLNLAQSPDETTTTLRTSAATVVAGQTVTLTATVTALGGGVVQNGVVNFYDGNTLVSFALLDANGVATAPDVSLGVGIHALTAVLRSRDFPASTSAAVAVTVSPGTVTPAPTTVALGSSLNPAVVGQAVTFTATVQGPAGSGTPTGTVTFQDGNVILGTFAVEADGTATVTTSFATAGGHAITASYSGDTNFAASSQDLTEQVNAPAAATTTTTLGASAPTAVFGQAETLTATVNSPAGVPTGTVTFLDGNTVLGTAQLNAAGQAALTVSLGVGNHQLTAVYGGTGGFAGSTSAAAAVTVNRAATAVSLRSSVNPAVTGQAVTFTATVAAAAPGAGTPSGTVKFKDGSVVLGTVAVGAGGQASFTTIFSAAGSHNVTAVYSGDANFVGKSRTLTEQVNAITGLQQGGFETPAVGAGAFAYTPAGSAWTFGAGSGVSGNGSDFTFGNPNATEGNQVAFLQGAGSFSQSVNLAAGTYQLTFQAAQRGNFQEAWQDFRVLVDGVAVGTFTPSGTGYSSLSATFSVAAGPHTITFQGLDSAGGDNTAFIDNVQLNALP
jgi:streptogramin lyase